MQTVEMIPYFLICLTVLSSWFSKKLNISLIVLAIASCFFMGKIQFSGILALSVLGLSSWSMNNNELKKITKSLGLLVFTITSLGLLAHKIPGFGNDIFFNTIQYSIDSVPFTMYLNYDKPFIGVFLLLFYVKPKTQERISIKSFFKNTALIYVALLILIIPMALISGYINLDFKFPNQSIIWMINNLLIVCMAEEVFFRGFIQGSLTTKLKQNKYGGFMAIAITSVLFGLAHYRGGSSYILLSVIAGSFYGYAYYKTKRIESSILIHFLLNLVHFVVFSYPALK